MESVGYNITYNPYVRASKMWWIWLDRFYFTVDVEHPDVRDYKPKWADPKEWRD